MRVGVAERVTESRKRYYVYDPDATYVEMPPVEGALALVAEAKALAHAGCFALVLEGVPDVVAAMVTAAVDVPTIGIGASAACDGQVLVLEDMLGLSPRAPKFVRRYGNLGPAIEEAIAAEGQLSDPGGQLPSGDLAQFGTPL